jgi:YegS/Rv2252/BmrU family lipid kinase
MSVRTLVVVNPRSRSGATQRQFASLEPRLRDSLGVLEVEWTRAPRDAERIAREGVRAGFERIVVAGGDGTTSEVVSGLLGAQLGDYAEVAPLPLGTGGDLMRTLGVPRQLDRALEEIAAGRSKKVDAGRVRYTDRSGRERTSHFLNVTSFGVSGLITELVNRATKVFGGRVSFLLGTLRGITRYRPEEVRIRVQGELVHEGPLVLGTAANGRFFGGGMQVAPRAEPADGLFDVVVIPGFSKARLLRELPRIYRGTHLDVPEVSFHRGQRVEAEAAPGRVWVEVDGEPLGTLPASIEVLPNAISVLGSPG